MSPEPANVQLYLGDCLEVMAGMEPNSIDTILTDPPYGLSFMGKEWDHGVPGVLFWEAALRVAKPGAMLMAFGGTRTWHRLAVAIEDAGWEIRDTVMWLYGSGFPKSHNISVAIDKAAGAEREVVGRKERPDGSAPRDGCLQPKFNGKYNGGKPGLDANDGYITAPATEAAALWDGWGTSLKPAHESIIVAQKPSRSLTPGQLFAIMGIVNVQLLMEITLCQARLRFSASNAESHLKHLAQKSKEVAQNTALRRVWDYPNEGELMPFVASVENHLRELRHGLEKMNLATVPGSAKGTINAHLPESLTLTGAAEDLFGLMDMLLSEMEPHIDLSMISSWNSTLLAALNLTNRFTISTAFEATTVLRTLNWSLFQNIFENIIPHKNDPTNGHPSPVSIVASYLNAARENLNATLTHIAAADATASVGNLRPNFEPIILAMKPVEKNFATNALRHGVAGLNIDGGRIPSGQDYQDAGWGPRYGVSGGNRAHGDYRPWIGERIENGEVVKDSQPHVAGRWPANVILDEEAARQLDEMSGVSKSTGGGGYRNAGADTRNGIYGKYGERHLPDNVGKSDSGGVSRFFYCAKASKRDRSSNGVVDNIHPTCKPTELLRYLARLSATPTGGVILDPFLGSGSTGVAAIAEGRSFVGIEISEDYFEIAKRRIEAAQPALLEMA